MFGRLVDNAIGIFLPGVALRNEQNRQARQVAIQNHERMREMFGGSSGPYEAGKRDRTGFRHAGKPTTENESPAENVTNMRGNSWRQFRNNPQARKIVGTLQAKVVGKLLQPQSHATFADGTSPHTPFRDRVKKLWSEINSELDYRGRPAFGGQTLIGLHNKLLAGSILNGGIFYRFHHLTKREQKRKRLTLPLQVQLISRLRLDESYDGDGFYRGMKVGEEGPEGYQILNQDPATGVEVDSVYVPIVLPRSGGRLQISFLHVEHDADQFDGIPWMCASMPRSSRRNEYELALVDKVDAEACIAMGYRRSGGGAPISLPGASAPNQLQDPAGNPITHFQRKMIVDLGETGDLVEFGKNSPNPNAPAFIQHLTHSEAVGVPGVKGTTLTGDHSRSSFSAERSADNDVWPEIEQIQEWFSAHATQPIYEEIVITAVENGYFDDVDGFSVADFNARQKQYLSTTWQGPVPRSINPKDDEQASRMRVQNGRSTPQREATAAGTNWLENLEDVAEFIEQAKAKGIPEDVYMQMLGIEQIDQPEEPEPDSDSDDDGDPIELDDDGQADTDVVDQAEMDTMLA